MENANRVKSSNLSIGVDEKISWQQSLVLGLQHVLAMDVYVPPVIIASAVAMSSTNSAALIQSTFLGAGIASLIQVIFSCVCQYVRDRPLFQLEL